MPKWWVELVDHGRADVFSYGVGIARQAGDRAAIDRDDVRQDAVVVRTSRSVNGMPW